MHYDFDEVIDRHGTNCCKWDGAEKAGHSPDEISMWVADMDFRCPQPAIDALVARAQEGIFGYTQTPESYYTAMCDWFGRRHGFRPREEWVVITPGVCFALSMAVRCFTREGDTVLIQPPVYYPFANTIVQNGRRVANAPLTRNDDGSYSIDFDVFERVVREERPTLFIMSNPHNPVGRAWTEDELRRMGQICQEAGVLVVADEIHADFDRPGHPHVCYASLGEAFAQNCVVCTAPSKTFNLAGLQLSNILIPNPELRRRFADEVCATGYDEPSCFGLAAAQACFTQGDEWLDQLKDYLEGNIALVRDFIAQRIPTLKFTEPESTYLLWVDCRGLGLTDEELTRFIQHNARLWLDMGSIFGKEGEGFIRLNVACPRSVVKEALERLEAAANGLSR